MVTRSGHRLVLVAVFFAGLMAFGADPGVGTVLD